VVLDELKYKDMLNILLEFEVYENLSKDPTAKLERKAKKLVSGHKTTLSTDLKHKLTPCHRKTPHSNALSKIHKLEISLRPILSSVGSHCYTLAGWLSP
jgi:hypothetical protein